MSLHSKVMSAWRLPRQFVNQRQTSWEWRGVRHAAKLRCSLATGLLRKFFTTNQQQSWSISNASSAGMCAAIICCHAQPLRAGVPHVPKVYVRRFLKKKKKRRKNDSRNQCPLLSASICGTSSDVSALLGFKLPFQSGYIAAVWL